MTIEGYASFADLWRLLALGLTVMAVAFFPMAIWKQGRHWSAWLAVVGAEIAYLSMMFAIVDHMGEPIVWYRTPLATVASFFTLGYAMYVFLSNSVPNNRR